MAINFPTNPSNGDAHAGFTYNSTKGVWESVAPSMMPTSDTPPTSPSDGQMWFDTDGGGAFVYYEDTDSAQWVEVIGSAGAAGPAGADGSAAVYATVDDLPETASAGDQAFVTASNRLYLWNGSGWYNIALINTTPTISGVSSSYTLATDGTATTVTITATDPEGLPITYSIASDTSGNIATVTSNNNVFTITPSTNTADAGSFSLTFRASDGVNIATAPATFTLQFSIENSKYTTGLFTSTGANAATNSTFTDASTNAVSFNVSNVYQTSFSPYRPGGYSTYFDGAGDYLKVTDSAEHDFGTGDFSMEFWWWPESLTGGTGSLHIMISAPNNSHNQLIYHESTYWYFRMGSSTVYLLDSSGSGAATAKQWNHVVLCRSGSTLSIFHNGTRTATDASAGSESIDFSNASIGRYDSGGYEIDGYIRDMRWLKGSSAYDATQTSIAVPSEPVTAITNTTLLTCHLPYIADGSTNGHTITPNGNVSVKAFTPYDYTEEYSAATNGGSLCGNANGELTGTLPSALGSGDFTIEGWFYSESGGSNTGVVTIGNHGANGIAILLEDTGKFRIDLQTDYNNNSTSNIQLNTWNHFKVIRSSGTITAYLNGVQEQSFSNSLNITATNITIGGRGGLNGYQHQGNLADIKVTASAASDTTVPTSVVSSTNALFHLPFIEAGIIDKSQTAFNAVLAGNTQSSTTQTKYLSSSMYFDGSGDYIEVSHDPVFNLTKDFTIECWAYFDSLSSNRVIIEKYDNTNSASWELYWRSTGSSIAFYADATPLLQDPSTSTVTTGQWYHIAVSRTGSTVKLFIDGTEVDSATSSTAFTTTVPMQIGRQRVNNTNHVNGYLSDVRITNGLGRYTANFTPPTAALQG